MLVGAADRLWVTVGSDHTDRKAESFSVAVAKQICAKAVGRTAWRFEEVEPHWDRLMLRSFIQDGGKRVLYQEGTAGQDPRAARLDRGLAGRQAAAGRRGDVLRHPALRRVDPAERALRDGARGPGVGADAHA